MEYRNDLEAARLRINTLEAKLDESKAALDARDAELAECRAERDRLRQAKNGVSSGDKSNISLKSFAAGFGLASILAASVLTVLVVRTAPPHPPATIAPTEQTSGAQGKIRLPPPAPPDSRECAGSSRLGDDR
jgi:hypothetical protein